MARSDRLLRQNPVTQNNGARVSTRQNSGDRVDLGPLTDWIGFQLRMAQIASFQAVARKSHHMGVRPGRFATLMIIGRNPGISQTALSRANGRDKSSLTPVLTDLVRRKLVKRTRAAGDRRTYGLTLTQAGEKALRELLVSIHEHEAKLDAIVGPRERAQFLRTLKRISDELS